MEFGGFVDSNYVGNVDDSMSTIGYVLMLGGSFISSKSLIQSYVALSNIEAVYLAVSLLGDQRVDLATMLGV